MILLSKKRITITGGSGFIGRGLIETLSSNFDITIIDRVQPKLENKTNIEFVQSEITNIQKIKEAIRNGYALIHLAAAVRWKPKTKSEELEFIKINTEASDRLFKACLDEGIRKVLFFSTNDVYSPSMNVIDEQTEPRPNGIYGRSKLEAEEAGLRLFRNERFPICIFRPASVYGNYDPGSMRTLIKISSKGIVPITGKGDNIKALAYINDVVGAVLTFLNSLEDHSGEIYNICSGNYTFLEIIDAIRYVYNYNPMRVRIPKTITEKIFAKLPYLNSLATASENKNVSFEKMINKLGYSPKFTLVEALQDCSDYYKKM